MNFVALLLIYVSIYYVLAQFKRGTHVWQLLLNIGSLSALVYLDAKAPNMSQLLIIVCSLTAFLFVHWMILKFAMKSSHEWVYWLSLATPIVLLVIYKVQSVVIIVGYSYICFRMMLLIAERNEGEYENLSFLEFFNYSIFFPTVLVGPITSLQSLRESHSLDTDVVIQCLGRIVYGCIKLLLVGSYFIFKQWHDVYLELVIKGVGAYLYLYLNFSGYCDIVIGASRLLGMEIKENFDNPMFATNIQDFWGRWHMSLSHLVRDVLFMPLFLMARRRFNNSSRQLLIMAILFLCFLTIGIWHEVSWPAVSFAAIQTLAITGYVFWKTSIRPRFAGVLPSFFDLPLKLASWLITFLFISVTMGVLWRHEI
jgi:alginate O-acetyltransferase complex protein AlgI